MGRSNLHYSLEAKLASTLGELQLTETDILRVETLAATLTGLRTKAQTLHELVKNMSAVLKHIDPDWTPENGPAAVVPNVHKAPTKIGHGTRLALDTLRDAQKPMTVREITDEVVVREGLINVTDKQRAALRNSVQAGLRGHRDTKVVFRDGQYPQRWVTADHLDWIEVDETSKGRAHWKKSYRLKKVNCSIS